MEKKLPQYIGIPIGIAFVVTSLLLLLWGVPMAMGKGNITYFKKG